MGFNTGEEDLKEATLHELSEPDAVAWASVCGDKPGVKLAWACKDLTQNDQAEGLTVCSSLDSHKAVTFFFAPHLQQFFADRAVGEAAQVGSICPNLASNAAAFGVEAAVFGGKAEMHGVLGALYGGRAERRVFGATVTYGRVRCR